MVVKRVILAVLLATSLVGAQQATRCREYPLPLPGSAVLTRDLGGAVTIDTATAAWVAVDSVGDIYVTGKFRGRVDFGGAIRTTASTEYDVFVAKYSRYGALRWVKQWGGSNSDLAVSIAVDSSGNVLVAGTFAGTTNVGGGSATSAGFDDAFIAKYLGTTGAHVWSHTFGGTSPDATYAVAVDSSNNVFVTGYFQGGVDFGTGTLTSAGSKDMYLLKYNSSGTIQWAKQVGGTGADVAENVAIDASGNVIILGTFNGTVDFGGGGLVSAGSTDIGVAKYDTSGAHTWSFNYGDTTGEFAHGLAASSLDSSVVLTGEFIGTVNFGCGDMTNSNSGDIYFVKLNSSGTCQWAKQFGTSTTFGISGQSVSIGSAGNYVALAGTMSGNINLGNGTLSGSSADPYVAKFSMDDGSATWSRRPTGANSDAGFGVAMDSTGYVTFVGEFYEQVNFGAGNLNSPFPTGVDGFVCRYLP